MKAVFAILWLIARQSHLSDIQVIASLSYQSGDMLDAMGC
jgi:hypothetical protein